MSQRLLRRIRGAIISGDYDLTRHAIDEMAEDGLGILDVVRCMDISANTVMASCKNGW